MGRGNGFSLRGVAKTGIAWALHGTGADARIGRVTGANRLPLVLGYHRVVEDFATAARHAMPAMLTSRRMLEKHLDWIGRRFRVISLDELGDGLESAGGFEKPVAAITFDDGYRDVYEQAFPLLRKKGLPAAVFVVSDLAGTDRVPPHDRLYHLLVRAVAARRCEPRGPARVLPGLAVSPPAADATSWAGDPLTATRHLLTMLPRQDLRRTIEALQDELGVDRAAMEECRMLSWEMLAEMRRAGITIGSHTRSHALLTNEDRGQILEEAAGSRRTLEERLGVPVKHFAYPDGRFDATALAALAASGYRFAYTTCEHRSPMYPMLTIPRKLLWENSCLDAWGRFSPAVLSCHIHGIFHGNCRQRHDEFRSPRR